MAKNVNMISAKATAIAREQAALDAGMIYKAKEQLHGAQLYTYTVAALGLLGALTGGRKAFKASALSGLYGSDTVVRHHKAKGNIEATSQRGMVRLTNAGLAQFTGRESGTINGQKISSDDVKAMAVALKVSPSAAQAKDNAMVGSIQWRKVGSTK